MANVVHEQQGTEPIQPAACAAHKRCARCKQSKSPDAFGVSRSCRDGLNPYCKECVRALSRERYHRLRPAAGYAAISMPERAALRAQGLKRCAGCTHSLVMGAFGPWTYGADGLYPYCRDCVRTQNARRYAADPQTARAQARRRYWRHRETTLRRLRDAYARDPSVVLVRNRAQYRKHRPKRLAYRRRYAAAHGSAVSASIQAWRRRNPEAILAHNHARRARERRSAGRWTAKDIALIYEAQRGRCAYCLSALEGGYHRDHVVPLSQPGASNWPWNIALSCQPCNNRKKDTSAGQFFARLIRERSAHTTV